MSSFSHSGQHVPIMFVKKTLLSSHWNNLLDALYYFGVNSYVYILFSLINLYSVRNIINYINIYLNISICSKNPKFLKGW